MRKRTTGYGASESRFRLHTRPAKVYRGWPTYAECKRIQKLADKAIARSKRRMAIASASIVRLPFATVTLMETPVSVIRSSVVGILGSHLLIIRQGQKLLKK